MKKNNNRIDFTAMTFLFVSICLFSTLFLSSSSSFYSIFLQFFYDKSSIAFGQTQYGKDNGSLALTNLLKHGSPYQGSKSAPVVLIDFSDIQCKLCQRFVKSTEPLINSTYVQTGKIVLVFKQLPNRGFDSFSASLATQCANEQGKFWQFHNYLYNVQGPIDSGWANKNSLEKLALQIPGVDIQKFNSCFKNQKYHELIVADIALAHSLGFTQTPSFVIVKNDGSNIQKLEGPQPFVVFQAVIDKEIKET